MILDKTLDEVVKELLTSVSEGLILIGFGTYFAHDKIREAAYSLLDPPEKSKIHYSIGSRLLSITPGSEIEGKIFSIVDHLNQGIDNIQSYEQRIRLAELNLLASKKAKKESAYNISLKYLRSTQFLISDATWKNNYGFALDYYSELGEIEYLNANYEEAEKYFKVILNNAKNLLDKIKVYEIKIQLYASQNKYECVELSLESLAFLGVTFSDDVNSEIMFEYNESKILLGDRDVNEILSLPSIVEDEEKFAAVRILSVLLAPAIMYKPEIFPLTILKAVNICLKYGNFLFSPFIYCLYGLLLGNVFGDVKSGFNFGNMALALMDKLNAKFAQSKTEFSYGTFIPHAIQHAREGFPVLLNSIHHGIETGDFLYSSYSLIHYSFQFFFVRENLESVLNEYKKFHPVITSLEQRDSAYDFFMWEKMVMNLVGNVEDKFSLDHEAFRETQALKEWKASNNSTSLFYYYLCKMYIYFFNEDFVKANEYSLFAEPLIGGVFGMMHIPEYIFFTGLINYELWELSDSDHKHIYSERIYRIEKQLSSYSANCPDNYEHKHLIVTGIIKIIEKQFIEANKIFDKAIESSIKYSYIFEEAYSNEICGRMWLSLDCMAIAGIYLKNSYTNYKKWGTLDKSNILIFKYNKLLKDHIKEIENTSISREKTISGMQTSFNIDIQSILRITSAISSEIRIDNFLKIMMKIIIENAGADKGILILKKDLEYFVEASLYADEKEVNIMQSIPINESKEVSLSIVNYVERSKKHIVLNNASTDNRFSSDKYVLEQKTKSALCFPIIFKSEISGIIYLENNLSENVFTPERINIINILSSQAAISLENAKLYLNLEKATREKTKALTEMEIARQIQTSLLPLQPEIAGYELMSFMKTAEEVSGDYYDVIYEDGKYWFAIGDASGHGVTAGLIMMMVQTSIHTIIRGNPNLPINEMLGHINKVISDNIKLMNQKKYMTITLFVIDGNRIYYSGFHQDLIIYRADKREIEILETRGSWLGYYEMLNVFYVDSIEMNEDDLLFLFTDGITEAISKNGKMFDLDGLKEYIQIFGNRNLLEMKEELLKIFKNFSTSDDVTFMILKKI